MSNKAATLHEHLDTFIADTLSRCTRCGKCFEACPEGINAMKMVRVGQMSAMGSLGAPAALSGRESKDFFRVINAFSETQLSAEEMERWQR